MPRAVVFGAGGFIGSHLVKRLKAEKYTVLGVDLKHTEFDESLADEFWLRDLRHEEVVCEAMVNWGPDELYQLAADMGGAGFVFTKMNDADIMLNSAGININTAKYVNHVPKIFYSSSACVYPEHNQMDPNNPMCAEATAYPANPDSNYGWEKLFAERMYDAMNRNRKSDVRIARFHNVYGPYGTYQGGREKAPAALCRKVVAAKQDDALEIWGDGKQTRSFMYIDDCVEGIRRFMTTWQGPLAFPINLGSEEMVTINDLAEMIINLSGKNLMLRHDRTKPQGVRGRNSDNRLCRKRLEWEPSIPLKQGIKETYTWIEKEMNRRT